MVIEILLAVIIALLFSVLLVTVAGIERPGRPGLGPGLFFFFILLFALTWAGGIWLAPFGPALWGVYWIPFLVVGLFVALLIAVLLPRRRPRTPVEAQEEAKERAEAEGALSFFFWVLIAFVALSLILHYFWRPMPGA